MNLHDAAPPDKPQIYIYRSMDEVVDWVITRGDIDVVYVNWQKLDGDYFDDYEPEDFLRDWRALGTLASPQLRAGERSNYLTEFEDRAGYKRDNRRWAQEREQTAQREAIARARQVLRDAGELP